MQFKLAQSYAHNLAHKIQPGTTRLEIVGSVKRGDKTEVHDIEFLIIPDSRTPRPEFGQRNPPKSMLEKVLQDLVNDGVLWPVKGGDRYKQFIIQGTETLNPFHLELWIVRPETWGIQNVIRTGPKEFSHRFVTNKAYGGLLPDEYEYIRGETRIKKAGEYLGLPEEADALALLGLGWIEPWLRKNYVQAGSAVRY
jgi:DNA polymerase/3'-5' exonuclease PolX